MSMGDPGGIGPEVIAASLADRNLRHAARFRLYGSQRAMHDACESLGIEPFWWRVRHDSSLADTGVVHDVLLLDFDDVDEEPSPPRPNEHAGRRSFAFVDAAIGSCLLAPDDPLRADAIVTGPISKVAWKLAGRATWPGHTELLASRFKAKRSAMMFVSPRLRVVLATVHVALMDVRNVLTIGRIFDSIDLGAQACRGVGIARPRIGVCGLNPHAGEGGLFGDEESRLIEPAILMAGEAGIDATGPYPADTIFNSAIDGRFDLVVAMYHDQGLIPVKLLDRDEAVNVTLGLPAPRTSPDHGTAFDIAGHGKANPGSMRSAIELAIRMSSPALT
jgi:4-hydroxythreonine-4-phosphate dehydrogenase